MAPNKTNNVAVFNNLDVRKYHVAIDGVRYPRDGVKNDNAFNDYLDQYRDLKIFYKKYVREELLNPLLGYIDMKNKYPIQVIDLSYQIDPIIPKKSKLFVVCRGATNNGRMFMILFRQRKIKMVYDGDKITEFKIK